MTTLNKTVTVTRTIEEEHRLVQCDRCRIETPLKQVIQGQDIWAMPDLWGQLYELANGRPQEEGKRDLCPDCVAAVLEIIEAGK